MGLCGSERLLEQSFASSSHLGLKAVRRCLWKGNQLNILHPVAGGMKMGLKKAIAERGQKQSHSSVSTRL